MIARELDHREWTATALSALGRVRRSCGDVVGARACHEEMLGIARELRTTLWIADGLSELGQDLLAVGPAGRRGRHLAEAIEAAHEALQFTVRPRIAQMELRAPGRAADGALARPLRALEPCVRAVRRLRARRAAVDGRGADRARPSATTARRGSASAGRRGARSGPLRPAGARALALARLFDADRPGAPRRVPPAPTRARLVEKVAAGLTGAPDLLRGFQASPVYREAATP